MATINPNVASAPSAFINFPRVHLEIMEKVIDVLNADADIDAVKACSQTCKALLPRCRTHIFSSIDLNPALSESEEDGRGETQINAVSHTRRITLFLNLLDQTPWIAFYVQELNLFIRQEDSNSSRTICALNLFSNLTSFKIDHDNFEFSLDWQGFSPDFISAIHRIISSPKLTKLGFASINNFPLSLFSLCPGIKSLSLSAIRHANSGSPPPKMTPISLQILSCDESGICLVEGTLMKSKHPILDLTQLQELTAHFYEERGNASMKEVLSRSESIVNVDLHGTLPSSCILIINPLNCFRYESLYLLGYWSVHSLQVPNHLPIIRTFRVLPLRRVQRHPTELQVLQAASNLQHISISLSLKINYRFPTGVLLVLDRLLTGPGFPRLGNVGLYLSAVVPRDRRGEGHEFKSAMEAVIREEFIDLSQSAHQTFESSVTVRDLLYFRSGGRLDLS